MGDSRIGNWFIRYNIGYKLLAIMLALMLWYYVAGQRDPLVERTFPLPVEARGLSSEIVLTSPLPEVRVTVRGMRSIIQNLRQEDILAYVDVSRQEVGEVLLPVRVDAPLGIQVLKVEPERIRVALDFYDEKRVPVRVQVLGEVDLGFTYQTPVAEPDAVTLRGPSKLLAKVQDVRAVLEVNGGKSSISRRVSVTVPEEVEGKVVVRPGFVQVRLPVVPSGPVKTVAVLPALQGEPKEGFAVKETRVEPNQIRVTGPAELLANLREVATLPVDITGAEGNVTREVGLALPDGVINLGQARVKVTVNIGAVGEEQLPEE